MAMPNPVDKFRELLSRLVQNDSRFFDCMVALARDHLQWLRQYQMDIEAFIYEVGNQGDMERVLLYLYVIDSFCKRLNLASAFEATIVNVFRFAFERSFEVTKEKLVRLQESWTAIFSQETMAKIRDIVEPPPPIMSTPTRSPENYSFDLSLVNEMLREYSNTPQDLLNQAQPDKNGLLFEQLNQTLKTTWELNTLEQKMSRDTQSVAQILEDLYGQQLYQCKTCGHRFESLKLYTKHLDWHFQKNNVQIIKASPWLPPKDSWIQVIATIDPQISMGADNVDQVVKIDQAPCDTNQLNCPLCGEQFDIVSQNGEWKCNNAIIVYIKYEDRDVIVHKDCVDCVDDFEQSMVIEDTPTHVFQDCFE